MRPLSEKISNKPLAFEEIVGSAPPFRSALAVAAKAARARVSVLIEGESGSGKEVIAQAIHTASPRGRKPMVTVNCGAIPENLVESVLFGHEKGALTGAFDRHVGRFEDRSRDAAKYPDGLGGNAEQSALETDRSRCRGENRARP